MPLDAVREAIASFHGVQRRFTVVGQPALEKGGKKGDVMIIDDYGHHPAEIEATLDAAQRGFDRRVVVAFQPHRYTRTQALFEDFTRAFNKADVVLVKYEGKLDDGTVFDANEQAPMQVAQVVPGFSEALTRMKKGGQYKVTIPAQLGYGDRAVGPIPAGSTLHFDVTLLDFRSEAEVRAMQQQMQQMQQQQMMQQQGGSGGPAGPPSDAPQP